jgi:hypothetical protein
MKGYSHTHREQTCDGYLINWLRLGMARGIPRSSFPEVPDLFSLPDSPRNRFYHSSAPRGPRKNSPRTSKILNFLFEHLNMKKKENFRKFSEICHDFSVFILLFFRITDQFSALVPNIPNFEI